MKGYTKFFKLILFLLTTQYCVAQTPTVKTFVDKQTILIGEQIKYTVVASFPKNSNANWFTIPDSIPHFDLIEIAKIDTSINNGNNIFKQVITLTSFDSGKWNTPAFAINFTIPSNNKVQKIYSDSIPINVGYAISDSSNQLRDIKPIITDNTKPNYIKIAIIVSLAILAFVIILVLLKKYLKKKDSAVPVNKISAYDEAMQSLNLLQNQSLQNDNDVKIYHTKLGSIAKQYLGRQSNMVMQNKTTSDVLVYLSANNFSKDVLSNVATALRCADAVKFAKYLPSITESNENWHKIKEAINFIHSSTQQKK